MQAQRPRKRFGQHFLHDPAIIGRIVRAINPRPQEHVVEIGPGRGALTAALLEHCAHLDVIELDRDLIPVLKRLASAAGRLTIHQADALQFDFATLAGDGRPLRIAGNLPYNISTPLLFHLLSYAALIRDMHFMLQKEVVERMAAQPGNSAYGRLSVMIQYRCLVADLFHIGPGAFMPPPKVESAFVRLIPHATLPHTAQDEGHFEKLVKQAFAYRRKTLRNALKGLADAADLSAAGIDPGQRPETVGVERYVALSNRLNG
ncbi:MAG: 16S rRNA (adenine(1518)-N(6)/adenine(1519)-N(6))-dimethyltransferase RsmA [Gammaproteobacteria bacterium]